MTDVDLIQATIEGKRDAYAALVDRYAADIFATSMSIIANVDDARDISQEAFLRGFIKIGQLRSVDKFRPWIIGIARNLALDHLRQKKKREIDPRITISTEYEVPDDYLDIHEAIARLSEKYRLPLLLYYFDGRSSDSVAEALDLSRDGVLTRLSRGRRELRRILAFQENKDERKM